MIIIYLIIMKKAGDITIVYEDENFLVINKPAFLAVHSGFQKKDFTLVDWLNKKYPPSGSVQLLNRIDKETSGIVLVAKNQGFVHRYNQELIKNIYKEYILLAKKPKKKFTEINIPLKGIYKDKNISQKALTRIISCKNLKKGVSLFHVSLITGRTHQIRRHFKMMGAPVVGDWQYGNIKLNQQFRKEFKLRRQFLHAFKVGINGFPDIEAPLPDDLQKIIDKLS
ncbi:MAG: RluA family pseudouridine synthase [Candidatus Margulisbacteria bacterium]|nr:RluA family pseudouridine synthase [Candidatus Margulisiibacteriota bacterium]